MMTAPVPRPAMAPEHSTAGPAAVATSVQTIGFDETSCGLIAAAVDAHTPNARSESNVRSPTRFMSSPYPRNKELSLEPARLAASHRIAGSPWRFSPRPTYLFCGQCGLLLGGPPAHWGLSPAPGASPSAAGATAAANVHTANSMAARRFILLMRSSFPCRLAVPATGTASLGASLPLA